MEVTITGLPEAITALNNADNSIRAGMRRALFRIGGLVHLAAVSNAPISPSTDMLKVLKKAGGSIVVRDRTKKGKTITVNNTAFYADRMDMLTAQKSTTRPAPGGLQSSIKVITDENHAEIFVPSNSPAGSYAFKMHDEKGSKWKERGPGTQAKGPQADDKFIFRAITDNEGNIIAIMKDQIDKAIGGEV
jgi:hypothetical protein